MPDIEYSNFYRKSFGSFGMLISERSQTFGSKGYRFGFNGKESDDEVSGNGNQYDYGFRIYNPRIAKFLSVDPLFKSYPWYTPFQFAGNKPIWAIDLDGLEESIMTFQMTWDDKAFLRGEMSWGEHQERAKARLLGGATGLAVVADYCLTGGQVTKSLVKQFAIQFFAEGASQLISGNISNGSVSVEDVVLTAMGRVDLFDALVSPYKPNGQLDEVFFAIMTGTIDVSLDGSINTNKSATDMGIDILSNYATIDAKWASVYDALKTTIMNLSQTEKEKVANDYYSGTTYSLSGDAVRIRSTSSLENTDNVLGLLSEGTSLFLTGNEEGGMSQVILENGTKGWVSTQYIQENKSIKVYQQSGTGLDYMPGWGGGCDGCEQYTPVNYEIESN